MSLDVVFHLVNIALAASIEKRISAIQGIGFRAE